MLFRIYETVFQYTDGTPVKLHYSISREDYLLYKEISSISQLTNICLEIFRDYDSIVVYKVNYFDGVPKSENTVEYSGKEAKERLRTFANIPSC